MSSRSVVGQGSSGQIHGQEDSHEEEDGSHITAKEQLDALLELIWKDKEVFQGTTLRKAYNEVVTKEFLNELDEMDIQRL